MWASQTRHQDHLGAETHPSDACTAQMPPHGPGVRTSSPSMSTSSSSTELRLRTGAVVIDTGTWSCKAGFSGQQTPIVKINTAMGISPGSGEDRPKDLIGEEALLYPDTEITEPMQNGVIINWDEVETLWQHLFDHELQVPAEEYALLITEPLLSPTTHREKMIEIAFESLGSPGFLVAEQPVLSTYTRGRTSGLVVDVGCTASRTMPVHEGYSLAHATKRMHLAGSHLSWYLMMLLEDPGYILSNEMAHIVEDIKHKCCYIASDFESECQLRPVSCTLDFPLPDGQTISLSRERFECPEILFNPPSNWGISHMGIHEMAHRSLDKAPEDIRSTTYRNILLCGGSSLFEGLERRFCSELLQSLPPSTEVGVVATPLRRYSAWIGGSILTSLKNFQTWWIRRDEYDEEGPRIVHQRCY